MSKKKFELLDTYKNKFWFNKPSFFMNCNKSDQILILDSLAEKEKSYLADSMSRWGRFYSLSPEVQRTIFNYINSDAQYKILSAKYDTLLGITGNISGYFNLSPKQRSNLYLELSDNHKEKLKNCSAYQWDLKVRSFVKKQHFVWDTIYRLTNRYCDGELGIYCNKFNQFFREVGVNTFLAVAITVCVVSVFFEVVISGTAFIAITLSLFLFEVNIIFLRTFGGNSIMRGLNFEKVVDRAKNKKQLLIKQNELNKENDISTDISDNLNQSNSSDKSGVLQLTKKKKVVEVKKQTNVK